MSRIAIIGTGIAGMGAAHLLHKKHEITIFEQNDYIGGHTNTVYVEEDGKKIPIDTGFIVFNYFTYPRLCQVFEEIQVEVKKTDMSFSVQFMPTHLEYSGSNLNTLFAQRKNIFSIKHIRFLLQINRFNKECIEVMDNPKYFDYSVNQYLEEKKYSEEFTFQYLMPMTSALWSTPTDITLTFPIVSLVRFFKNHGFLGLDTQFQWYTVHNGSWEYRNKLIQPFKDRILVGNKVVEVTRNEIQNKVEIKTAKGEIFYFDKVIIAAHADQALAMLTNPSTLESQLLAEFKYQKNIATLHTDENLMPKNKLTWAAWNYRIDKMDGKLVPHCVYNMNILQNVSKKKQYMLSINDPGLIDKAKILKTIQYEHPVFTVGAMKAQSELPKLNENGLIYFCGSYFKYGFHEDALASSFVMVEKINVEVS
jgi:uncharacterized protein